MKLLIEVTLAFFFAAMILSVYTIIDHIITKKRLKQNQKEWNEHSKNMNHGEKLEAFGDWLHENRIKYGWKYLYIPKLEDENEATGRNQEGQQIAVYRKSEKQNR